MITHSKAIATGTFTLALAAHMSVVMAFFSEKNVLIEGGGQAVVAKLGNSFADYVQGTTAPQEVEERTKTTRAETVTSPVAPTVTTAKAPPRPETAPTPAPVPTVAAAATTATPPVDPTTPRHTTDLVKPAAPTDTPQTPPSETVRLPALTPTTAPNPILTVTTPAALRLTANAVSITTNSPTAAPRPNAPVSSPAPSDTLTTEALQTVTATDLTTPAVQTSPRPMARPAALTRPAPAKAKPPSRTQAGNSTRNATSGSDNGVATATATTSGTSGTPTRNRGNAAVANYPGKVMRRISRVPRPNSNHRGSALIGFSIGANGGLTGLHIARSSGSARLDKAAMSVVRRAAPFPAPPPGARRSFSVQIRGR